MNPYEYTERQEDKVQYTSIERIIEMIHHDYKFIPRLNVAEVLEWIGAIYGLINYPGMYRRMVTGTDPSTPNVLVSQYRGELPIGFRRVLKAGVRDYTTKEVYRPSTGTFTEFQYGMNEAPQYTNTEKVYTIRGGYIFIEDLTATLQIAYEAFPIDERGYPLVPDNEQVLQYAKEYIASMVCFNLVAAKKLDPYIFETIDKRRMWRAGSAQASLHNRTADEMETWTWTRLKLMPRFGHDSSFSYQGNKEDLTLGTNMD